MAPDFKTIADFRKDHGDAIRKVCREFVVLCRRLKLFTDGIALSTAASSRRSTTATRTSRIASCGHACSSQSRASRYLAELGRADRDASTVPRSRYLKEKLAKVKEQMRSLGEIGEQMNSSVDGQLSMTDPDAKAGTWHRLTLNDRIGERATTGAQPGTTTGPWYLPVRVLILDLRERPELADGGCNRHRSHRHIAD